MRLEFSDDNFKDDIRPAGEGRGSSKVVGPIDKSFFRTKRFVTFEGATARYLRLKLPAGVTARNVKVLSEPLHAPVVTDMKATDLIADDNRTELICRTRDGQLAVISSKGRLLWRKEFQQKILCTAALKLDEAGKRQVLVVDSAATLWRFGHDGKLLEKFNMAAGANRGRGFFRFNRVYSMGAWKPAKDEKPYLMMGGYQSVLWRKPDGEMVCYPERTDERPYRSGFVWRGLVYWERMLDRGIDVNGDGVEDQVFLARGWGRALVPTLLFFDGRTHEPIEEYKFSGGLTLGLEIVELNGGRFILAANEFNMGLYSLKGEEVWTVRFDTPAVGYALSGTSVAVAKRDGLVLLVSGAGKVVKRQFLAPELSSIAAGDKAIMVAGDEGVFCLDAELNVLGSADIKAKSLSRLSGSSFAAALEDGGILSFEK